MTHTLRSEQDTSVNWVLDDELPDGYFEVRFVQRDPTYFVCYLSVQSGCNHGCRFCGLTATKQTRSVDATLSDLKRQAKYAMSHSYNIEQPYEVETVHFNFMARGEPLASKTILENWPGTVMGLNQMALERGVRPKYLISTILPKSLVDTRLVDIFREHYPELYYSLYSMREGFRRYWMPQALPATEGLDKLAQWQQDTNKIPTIHLAFIQGSNDSMADVEEICCEILERKLRVNVNIVRYNPPPGAPSVEPSAREVNHLASGFEDWLPEARVKVVDRVGEDVYASCGMFVTADTLKETP